MAESIGPKPVVLTYEDYLSLPNDRNRYEIHEGELVMTPAPGTAHQMISRNLSFILFTHSRTHSLGTVLYAPVDVILSATSIAQPDIIYVSQGKKAIITGRAIEGAPDLVVEVLSPATLRYDRVAKLQLYARHGVTNYWIVSPEERTLEEYVLQGESYALTQKLSEAAEFRPALFPGFSVLLSQVWPE
ncbi:MAG: Uma2 family endonuclease [Candidatus Eremiobacteraeota bacterium]|nr:Uma2 family endonuclease [Candidatus Eremiobacteraeota bacterium]